MSSKGEALQGFWSTGIKWRGKKVKGDQNIGADAKNLRQGKKSGEKFCIIQNMIKN